MRPRNYNMKIPAFPGAMYIHLITLKLSSHYVMSVARSVNVSSPLRTCFYFLTLPITNAPPAVYKTQFSFWFQWDWHPRATFQLSICNLLPAPFLRAPGQGTHHLRTSPPKSLENLPGAPPCGQNLSTWPFVWQTQLKHLSKSYS